MFYTEILEEICLVFLLKAFKYLKKTQVEDNGLCRDIGQFSIPDIF